MLSENYVFMHNLASNPFEPESLTVVKRVGGKRAGCPDLAGELY